MAPVGATCSTSCNVSRARSALGSDAAVSTELLHLAVEQLVVARQQVAQLRDLAHGPLQLLLIATVLERLPEHLPDAGARRP